MLLMVEYERRRGGGWPLLLIVVVRWWRSSPDSAADVLSEGAEAIVRGRLGGHLVLVSSQAWNICQVNVWIIIPLLVPYFLLFDHLIAGVHNQP